MQAAVFSALEFDRIRDVLAARAVTPLGRARLEVLEPSTTPSDVRARLDLTLEAVAFERDGSPLGVGAPDDLEATIEDLAGAGALEPLPLLGLARFIDAVEHLALSVARRGGPGLASMAARVASFADETDAVTRAIEPTGDVSDRASAALRDIRAALRRQRASLRTTLDRLAHGRDTAKYLQDQVVTDRNGRYVLVVRAEHRDAIPGLVHGSSASGASLYLEPLATVALNNEVTALVEREKAEIHRILLALTTSFRARSGDLERTFDAAGDLDVLHAKADLARRVDGVAPDLATDAVVDFRGARHPLLIPAVRDLSDNERSGGWPHPVASDLSLVPPAGALVISGPNTGGKTVALKAFGLLALMAQSGLLVPVDPGSRFSPFRTIFADIGDAQSIAASLSTFSSHIARLVQAERALALPALVLLDEVGSGTDPLEGGALGTAVVDHFRRRGALVITTTHDDALKSYASTTPGVVVAGFGFHPDTYAPTYRLNYGAPGRSLALEIADRLGMPADVVADARNRLSGRESLLAAHLAQLDRQLAEVVRDRDDVRRERDALAAERARLLDREAHLTEREAVLKRRLDDRLNEKLREARSEVDRIVGRLKEKADALAQQAEARAVRGGVLTTGDVGGLKAEARSALGAMAGAFDTDGGGPQALTAPPVIGDKVFIAHLHAEGIVRDVSDRQVEVDVRGKRLRVKPADLRRPPAAAGRDDGRGRSRGSASRVQVQASAHDVRTTPDLVLVGATVDEAIDRASKFVDDALLADERRLRVVHGHGTGRLRDALTRYFREHPLVARVSPAPDSEGGNGATIVELKD